MNKSLCIAVFLIGNTIQAMNTDIPDLFTRESLQQVITRYSQGTIGPNDVRDFVESEPELANQPDNSDLSENTQDAELYADAIEHYENVTKPQLLQTVHDAQGNTLLALAQAKGHSTLVNTLLTYCTPHLEFNENNSDTEQMANEVPFISDEEEMISGEENSCDAWMSEDSDTTDSENSWCSQNYTSSNENSESLGSFDEEERAFIQELRDTMSNDSEAHS